MDWNVRRPRLVFRYEISDLFCAKITILTVASTTRISTGDGFKGYKFPLQQPHSGRFKQGLGVYSLAANFSPPGRS